MPSAKILSEKQAYVADLKAKFESAVSGCVVAYGGINVENDTKLRKELREAGVDYMVVKNTMLRLAVKGTSLEGLAEQFKGDTAIAFAHEEDKQNIIHVPVGKASFGAEKLYSNLDTVMSAIAKAKPVAAKGTYFKSATIATTMGPGIRLNTLKYGV